MNIHNCASASAAAAVVDAFQRGKKFVTGYPTACVNFLYGSVSRGNTDDAFVRNMGNVFNAVRNNFGAEAGIAISSKIESNKVKVDISIVVEYGSPVPDVAHSIQENVKKTVETMSGLEVSHVDVHIQGVSFEKENQEQQELLVRQQQ